MRVLTVHPLSAGLASAGLVPGRDVVLRALEADVDGLAPGVPADDHLDAAARAAVDDAALAALARWRAACDRPLTVDGLCLPLICEWPLMEVVMAAARAGAGLRAAIAAQRPAALELAGGDAEVRALVHAVAAAEGLPVREVPGRAAASAPPPPERRGLAFRAARTVLRGGAPSRLRPGAVVALSYWPLVPLLDRLLDDRDVRLAALLQLRFTSPRRTLRAMADGGWVGTPGPVVRAQVRRRLAARMDGARALAAPAVPVLGFDLGAAVHERLVALCLERAPAILADALVLRRAFRRARPALLLASYDTEPFPRLHVLLAREAGVPTFVLSHSAYLMPQTLRDMEHADEVAIYSEAVGFPGMRRDRPVHVVGYPVPEPVAPERRAPATPGRIVVLGANGHPFTSRFDERIVLRHLRTALQALAEAAPEAEVVLRPHPSQDQAPILALAQGTTGVRVSVDVATPIMELLRTADLCVGALTAATLQAAVAGAPVVVLNVTGFDWRWPIGGDTPVPVARDAAALAAVVRRWRAEGTLPGRDVLLSALGADNPGAPERLHRLVAAAVRRP